MNSFGNWDIWLSVFACALATTRTCEVPKSIVFILIYKRSLEINVSKLTMARKLQSSGWGRGSSFLKTLACVEWQTMNNCRRYIPGKLENLRFVKVCSKESAHTESRHNSTPSLMEGLHYVWRGVGKRETILCIYILDLCTMRWGLYCVRWPG